MEQRCTDVYAKTAISSGFFARWRTAEFSSRIRIFDAVDIEIALSFFHLPGHTYAYTQSCLLYH